MFPWKSIWNLRALLILPSLISTAFSNPIIAKQHSRLIKANTAMDMLNSMDLPKFKPFNSKNEKIPTSPQTMDHYWDFNKQNFREKLDRNRPSTATLNFNRLLNAMENLENRGVSEDVAIRMIFDSIPSQAALPLKEGSVEKFTQTPLGLNYEPNDSPSIPQVTKNILQQLPKMSQNIVQPLLSHSETSHSEPYSPTQTEPVNPEVRDGLLSLIQGITIPQDNSVNDPVIFEPTIEQHVDNTYSDQPIFQKLNSVNAHESQKGFGEPVVSQQPETVFYEAKAVLTIIEITCFANLFVFIVLLICAGVWLGFHGKRTAFKPISV